MKERLEWELVPRVKDEMCREVEEIAEEILNIDALVSNEAGGPNAEQQLRLDELKQRMTGCILSPCDAAESPLLSSRPDWLKEAASTWESLPAAAALPLRDFSDLFGRQHDCTRCQGASSFPGASGIPCELDLGPLLAMVSDEQIRDQVNYELSPDEMLALAQDLEALHKGRQYTTPDLVDPDEYLDDVVRFLRFWAGKGFGVAPASAHEDDSTP